MARVKYPKALNQAYKGFISDLQQALSEVEDFLNRKPKAVADIQLTISTFLAQKGITPLVPGNQRVLTSGVKVTAPAITGTYVNGYTFTIVNGAITGIVAS